jgi:hypothetical protein
MRSTHSLFALAAVCLATACGCQSLPPPKWAQAWFPEEKPKLVESKYGKPVRLAVIWSPAMLNNPGAKPTRGFGGRIYFYDGENNAVPVEGQLVVYAYNNNKPDADGKTPDRRYAFTPEQFTEHFSPTELGASYSIWIPWDDVGNDQVEISLVPIFTASSGQLVVGQSSKSLLPGPATVNTPMHYDQRSTSLSQMTQRPLPGQYGAQQASYLEPQPPADLPPARVFSELTIKLPHSLAERIASAEPAKLPPAIYQTATALPAIHGPQRQSAAAQPAGSITAEPAGSITAPPAQPAPPQPGPVSAGPPSARSSRPGFPAPSWPGPAPNVGLRPTQPFPGGRPYGPPSPPLPGQ